MLKDATASSIYGARAANGVIVISTKRGKEGKLAVNYNMSAKFVPKADLSYLNLLNSSELVDLEIAGFKFYHPDQVDNRRSLSPVTALLYKHKAGELTDAQLADGLNVYRNTDNRRQIEDEFARMGLVHQHNLSLSGGSKSSRYIASLNYLGDYGNQRFQSKDRIGSISRMIWILRIGLLSMSVFRVVSCEIKVTMVFRTTQTFCSGPPATTLFVIMKGMR
ncbi:hypothetical protein [Porphyromonas cangingivalis]|uniref:hypothetical protein n=1 Tax=Porphyromonas cangingivalis TaxID=36874 RepID=UPI001F1AC749|nr:hypothetical protein [Porphyromonas cangingivalis]